MLPHDLPSPSAPSCELLTVEQFAEKLQISRATVFCWMQQGVLVAGRHFIRLGRVVRFPWSADLVAELLSRSVEQKTESCRVRPSSKPSHQRQGSPVNWDY